MLIRIAGSALIGLTACALSAQAQPLPLYSMTQIGPVPVNGVGLTFVGDINEKGELVGSVQTLTSLEIFLWRDGVTTVIGEGSAADPNLNDRSEVATVLSNPQLGTYEGFRWRRGTLQALGTPSSVSAFFPEEINNRGQILGYTFDVESFTAQAHLRQRDGTFQLLEGLPGAYSMWPVDLAENGVALGFAESIVDQTLYLDCVIWRDGTVERLNTGPERFCSPRDMNRRGQVVGTASFEGKTQAFIWEDGQMRALPLINTGDLANSAAGLNNKGQVVGNVYDSQAESRATLWCNGVGTDLNNLIAANDPLKPYVTLYEAYMINDDGWIVAIGLDSRREGGGSSPYLLRPMRQ